MGRVTGIQKYYCLTLLLFLFLTVFCFAFIDEFQDDQCLKEIEDTESESSDTSTDTSEDTNTDGDTNTNTDGDTNTNTDGDTNTNTDGDTNTNTDGDTNTNTDGGTNTNTDGGTNTNTDGGTNTNTDGGTNTNTGENEGNTKNSARNMNRRLTNLTSPYRNLQTTTDTTTNSTTTEEAASYTDIVSVLAICYMVATILVLLQILMLYYFSNLDIAKFAKLNFCQGCMGKLSKLVPYIIVLLHYVILIIIFVFIILVFGIRDCEEAEHINLSDGKIEKGVMQKQAESLGIILAAFWGWMHVVGGYLRRYVYYDSFFYQPEQNDARAVKWLLIRCGP